MNDAVITRLRAELDSLRAQGLFKGERVLEGPQGGRDPRQRRATSSTSAPTTTSGSPTTPRCARRRTAPSIGTATAWPRCASSAARRPCTSSSKRRLARFLGTEDIILYSSCFDANGGLFETVLDEHDAVISDALNHASIIDGIRLCKAQRLRYANRNLAELEKHLKETQDCRTRLIATDGVFSMDGNIAPARARSATSPTGTTRWSWSTTRTPPASWAPRGRGTPEHCGVAARIDILTGTFGKALGGGSGGYIAGTARSDRVAAAALAPVPVLQQHSAGGRRRQPARARSAREQPAAARHSCSRHAQQFRAGTQAQRASTSSPASIPSSR